MGWVGIDAFFEKMEMENDDRADREVARHIAGEAQIAAERDQRRRMFDPPATEPVGEPSTLCRKRRDLKGAVNKTAAAVLCLVVLAATVASAHEADRRTKASWYHAAGLQGACGGTMDHRSAASKWFGCGDRVMVVRPNGDHVAVTIEDRCQCGIDLDRAAARHIGIGGVARVALAKIHPGWRNEGSFAARWIRR